MGGRVIGGLADFSVVVGAIAIAVVVEQATQRGLHYERAVAVERAADELGGAGAEVRDAGIDLRAQIHLCLPRRRGRGQ